MIPYLYPISLAAISLFVALLERFAPHRRDQKQLRPGLGWDFLHLLFNGHFLGVIFFGVATRWLLPPLDAQLAEWGLVDSLYRNTASTWPLWVQIPVALVAIDFLQWCVHNLLHRVPFFWGMHKCHHSVEDGEMDWIVSFRFQWTEVVVYRMALYLPLAWFGFGDEAVMVHAIFGTLIGHLNHANLNLSWGPLRYVLNSPNMHIWHHDYEGTSRTTKNFGIIFSTWDWIFGTAYMPDEPPARLGFPGVEEFPKSFFRAEAWPLERLVPKRARTWVGAAGGVALLALGWWLHLPDAPGASSTPMLGETQASSRPDGAASSPLDPYPASGDDAERAVQSFGSAAAAEGFEHPEALVSVPELAAAFGAPSVVVLDVRPEERFLLGHIPGARQLYRGDYSRSEPISGVNRSVEELQAMLRARGVQADSVVVAYTDGGPEAYRLWWTLRGVAGYDIRVLDGGMTQWVQRGHGLAEGAGRAAPAGDVSLSAAPPSDAPRLDHWADVAAFVERTDATLLDTRERAEFTGEVVRRSAARGGRIPGAVLFEWWRIVRDVEDDHRLAEPATLRERLGEVGVRANEPVVVYCQSGTRSAGVFFALHQLGADPSTFGNYDGSWAEYSRLDPAALELRDDPPRAP